MRISKLTIFYLRDSYIDFKESIVLDIVIQDLKNALVITAFKDTENPYFAVQYKGTKQGYQSLDRLLTVLIETKQISKFRAKLIKLKYNNYIKKIRRKK